MFVAVCLFVERFFNKRVIAFFRIFSNFQSVVISTESKDGTFFLTGGGGWAEKTLLLVSLHFLFSEKLVCGGGGGSLKVSECFRFGEKLKCDQRINEQQSVNVLFQF